MRFLQIVQLVRVFPMFIHGCVNADGFIDKPVNVGGNATLCCSLTKNNVYWVVQRYEQPPAPIFLIFNPKGNRGRRYINNDHQKYSAELNNTLVIRNITESDCGVYFCMVKNEDRLHGPFNVSDGIRLTSAVCNKRCSRSQDHWSDGPFTLSITLNAVLTLLFVFVLAAWGRRRTRQATALPRDSSDPPPAPEIEYDLVQVSSQPRKPQRARNPSTIYYELQMPQTANTGAMFDNKIYTHT